MSAGISPESIFFSFPTPPNWCGRHVEAIQEIIRAGRGRLFRLYSYLFTNHPETRDVRRLYILEEEAPARPDPAAEDEAVGLVRSIAGESGNPAPDETVREFILSAAPGFIARGLRNRKRKNIENYFFPWMAVRGLVGRGEDLNIEIETACAAGCPAEKAVRLWLPREKFQENFGTINKIFERRGIPFTRQYFETFAVGGTAYICPHLLHRRRFSHRRRGGFSEGRAV